MSKTKEKDAEATTTTTENETTVSDQPIVVTSEMLTAATSFSFSGLINLIGNLTKSGLFDIATQLFKMISNPENFSLKQLIDLISQAVTALLQKSSMKVKGMSDDALIQSFFSAPAGEDGKVQAHKAPSKDEVEKKVGIVSPLVLSIIMQLVSTFGPSIWDWVIERFKK